MIKNIKEKVTCFHCGESCKNDIIKYNDLFFCCIGCKTVYEILSANNLCEFYNFNQTPGVTQQQDKKENYDYLNHPEISSRLITYQDTKLTYATFYIPVIHCSSCIWLLENLNKLNDSIIRSRVNFIKKEVSVVFNNKTTLADIAKLLSSIGYAPKINLDTLDKNTKQNSYFDKKYLYKLGITFFCFGNIMLLSFPEYFEITKSRDHNYTTLFTYLNFLLSLPVMFYSSQEFIVSAWNGIKQNIFNMDVPIALGIIIMFIQSSIEIFTGYGAGYMDTLASLVLLMLIGRAMQNMTYAKLSFDRDYKSYFPIAVTKIENQKQKQVPVTEIKKGDRLLIRNQEIIPADCILQSNDAAIDYSFVTGESELLNKNKDDMIYAGAKLSGNAIEVEVIKEISQSYLTSLWNDVNFNKNKDEQDKLISLSNRVSKYFTYTVLLIALLAALFWISTDVYRALRAFTSVLIITCPCALALTTPFTLGNTMRLFGLKKFYIKNTGVIEKLGKIDTIVFDKTGTITHPNRAKVTYTGSELNQTEINMILSLVVNSNHPSSKKIYNYLQNKYSCIHTPISHFKELPGKGIEGLVNNVLVKIGSARWLNISDYINTKQSRIYVLFNNDLKGYFVLRNEFRKGLSRLIRKLDKNYRLELLSGDNDAEKDKLKAFFDEENMYFSQSPHEKLNHIKILRLQHKNVLMIGDGLNDAGALIQSNVGIAVSDDVNNFSPACDAIIAGDALPDLSNFLKLAKYSLKIIITAFILSFIYNIIGLYFAVQGNLSPIIAAILMPLSSISVIAFTTFAVYFKAQQIFKKK
jgi:Cu+-exporting ATPase